MTRAKRRPNTCSLPYRVFVTLIWGSHSEVTLCPEVVDSRVGFRIRGLGKLGLKIGLDAYYLRLNLVRLQELGLVGNLERSSNRQEMTGWLRVPSSLQGISNGSR